MGRTFERRSTVDKGAQHLIVYPVPTTECQSVENSCDTAFDRWPLSSTSPFNDQDFIYIYTHALEPRRRTLVQLTLSFLFPKERNFSLCKFVLLKGRRRRRREDRIGTRPKDRVFYPRISFCSCSFPLSPSLRFCEENSCVSRGKKGQADAMHRYLDDKSNELIVFN